jgi:hypothetical protein
MASRWWRTATVLGAVAVTTALVVDRTVGDRSSIAVNAGRASPTIASVTPSELAAASTVTITVRGTGFQPGATLALSASTATVTASTPTEITAVVRTGAPDSFRPAAEDLVVTNPDGGTAVLAGAVTVNPVPIHYHAEPSTVAQGRTVAVEVTCGRCGSPAVAAEVEGTGVTATVTRPGVPHGLAVEVSPDAAPGPRAVTIVTADGGRHPTDPPLTVVVAQ